MKKLWFKNKTYGYGRVPASWQGWLVTLVYIAILIALSLTLDERSTAREIFLIFVLPLLILTVAFLRIAYKTGEKPEWRWGEKKHN